jgi:hypothetical protein
VLNIIRLSITTLLFISSFSCSSFAHEKLDTDELIYESHLLVVEKKYNEANIHLRNLLNIKEMLSFSQELNVLNKLLEISFIQKMYKDSSIYGHKLFDLIKDNPKYEDAKKRLYQRICISDDWQGGRDFFTDICLNEKE